MQDFVFVFSKRRILAEPRMSRLPDPPRSASPAQGGPRQDPPRRDRQKSLKIFLPLAAKSRYHCAWKMAYFSTEPASERRNVTGKNRVWDFFRLSNEAHPANRRQPAQPRRKIRPTPMKSASGIPYWPSRDPIGERGGANLYGFVGNDGLNGRDFLGLSESQFSLVRGPNEDVVVEKGRFRRGGFVGVVYTATYETHDLLKSTTSWCYCYRGKSAKWWIRKVMPSRQGFGKDNWSGYKDFKDQPDWHLRYFGPVYTYEGLDVHESVHVQQTEDLAKLIQSELEKLIGQEHCFKGTSERDKEYHERSEAGKMPVEYLPQVFTAKYGQPKQYPQSGEFLMDKAEEEATTREYEKYKEQYNETHH